MTRKNLIKTVVLSLACMMGCTQAANAYWLSPDRLHFKVWRGVEPRKVLIEVDVYAANAAHANLFFTTNGYLNVRLTCRQFSSIADYFLNRPPKKFWVANPLREYHPVALQPGINPNSAFWAAINQSNSVRTCLARVG